MERARLRPITKGQQITGAEREQIATRLRQAYNQGASIRDLMAQTGRSYGWTYRLLRESGAELRGRGGAHPRHRTGPTTTPTEPAAERPAARVLTSPAAPTVRGETAP